MTSVTDPVADLLRRVGAEVVMPRFRALAAHEIEEKTPGELVTIADREAELRLHDGLLAIEPGARIIGEEACAADSGLLDGLGEGRLWLIDPIDGTANYAAGKPPFGIMIAAVENGLAVAGWLYDPVDGRMCRAVAGGGAFVDDVRVWSRSTGAERPVATLATLYMDPAEREAMTARAAAMTLEPIPRCAAAHYPRLVLGNYDIALFRRTLPWDHAAGSLFLNEAGGRAARTDGTSYRVGDGRTGMLAAATPALWDVAAAALFG